MHKTLKRAEAVRSKIYNLYKQANLDLEHTKKRIKKEKLLKLQAKFFNTIKTKDIRRQLSLSALNLDKAEQKLELVKYSLE